MADTMIALTKRTYFISELVV